MSLFNYSRLESMALMRALWTVANADGVFARREQAIAYIRQTLYREVCVGVEGQRLPGFAAAHVAVR